MTESEGPGPFNKQQMESIPDEIEDLNASRPKPTLEPHQSPEGTEWKEVLSESAEQKNQEVDQKIAEKEEKHAEMQKWLDQHRGQAERDFNQSAEPTRDR